MKKKSKFVPLPTGSIYDVWKRGCKCKDTMDILHMFPDWYAEDGAPQCEECRCAFKYLRTMAKAVTVKVHVRGGVAYPPNRMPRHVKLEVIDHDNEKR